MSGPHDLLARYTFGHPERAAAELRAVLPAHVVSAVDWSSLRREHGSVVDPELKETESDLLFTARLRTGHPAQMLAGTDGAEHLVVVLRYLLWVGGERVHEAAGQVLHSVMGRHQAEDMMRSYGEQLIERGLKQGREEGREEGRAQGLLQGRAEAILRVLAARGVQVDEAARQRVLSCTEMATLDRWFDLSLKATTLSEALDDLAQ